MARFQNWMEDTLHPHHQKSIQRANVEVVLWLSRRDKWPLLGRSIFLHELVHHLQVVNEGQFECPEAAEVQAYQLQGQWLHEQGIQDVSALIGFSEVELNNMVACEAGF